MIQHLQCGKVWKGSTVPLCLPILLYTNIEGKHATFEILAIKDSTTWPELPSIAFRYSTFPNICLQISFWRGEGAQKTMFSSCCRYVDNQNENQKLWLNFAKFFENLWRKLSSYVLRSSSENDWRSPPIQFVQPGCWTDSFRTLLRK